MCAVTTTMSKSNAVMNVNYAKGKLVGGDFKNMQAGDIKLHMFPPSDPYQTLGPISSRLANPGKK